MRRVAAVAVGLAIFGCAGTAQAAQTFTNTAPISLPLGPGTATPSPSTVNVSGISGTPTSVTATLHGLSHTFAGDVDVLLVSPAGVAVMLVSDAGNDGNPASTFSGDYTFADGGAAMPGNDFTGLIPPGTYAPSNFAQPTSQCGGSEAQFSTVDPYVVVAPTATTMAAFTAGAVNGTWSLYAGDDCDLDSGSIAGGFSVTIGSTYSPYAAPRAKKPAGWTKVSGLYGGSGLARVSLVRSTGGRRHVWTGRRWLRVRSGTPRSYVVHGLDWRRTVPAYSRLPRGSYRLIVRVRGKGGVSRDVARFRVR